MKGQVDVLATGDMYAYLTDRYTITLCLV